MVLVMTAVPLELDYQRPSKQTNVLYVSYFDTKLTKLKIPQRNGTKNRVYNNKKLILKKSTN